MKVLYKNCLICNKKFNNLRKNGYTFGNSQFDKRIVCGVICSGKLNSKNTNRNEFICNGDICTMIFYEKGIKKETFFDKKFLEEVKKYNWYGVGNRYVHTINKRHSFLLHRLVMGNNKKYVVDHINGNGLDNRLKNLRLVTQQQNCINQSISINNTTGRRGVYEHKYRNRKGFVKISYVGHITNNYKPISKCFRTLQEAIDYRIILEKKFGFDKFMRYN